MILTEEDDGFLATEDDLIYKTGNKKKSKTYDSQMLKKIYSAVVTLNDVLKEQVD